MENKQGSLFDQVPQASGDLPAASRMPLNARGLKVYDTLLADLCEPFEALVITGYSALDQLLALISQRGDKSGTLRLMLGSEPSPSRRQDFSLVRHGFDHEVKNYWLKRGISLRLSGQLIHCIELIRQGYVRVRYPGPGPRLHAKLYCAGSVVTLGSSNFTEPGLHYQQEANVRFTESQEGRRFRDVWQVAESFWAQGLDADQDLIDLLEKLLRFVSWREALARACVELLEGEWADRYLQSLSSHEGARLWPSQRKGIGQALYLLETAGGVLVADATGSGKTRMGVHLLRAMYDRIWSMSRGHKGMMTMVCPPLVTPNWDRERTHCQLSVEVISHGSLSRLKPDEDSMIGQLLANAQTLAVDEAHNFLNQNSNRTRQLLHNLADQTVLFTATPINRSASDLLRLVDILGADNFDDAVLAIFERLNRAKGSVRDAHPEELRELQLAVASFTVRRTKAQLNAMVDQEPDFYRTPAGRVCRYPTHAACSYPLNEPAGDIRLAEQISVLAKKLKGVGHFEKALYLPGSLAKQGCSAESYLRMRLHSAGSLARHHVMASLRSSRLALFRHILGEEQALEHLGLEGLVSSKTDQDSGNMLQRLERLKGRVPENQLGIDLPEWLSDPKAHQEACEAEIGIYRLILRLLERITDGRERRKCSLLLELAGRHDQVIAFDHFPLTLRYLQHLMAADAKAQRIEVLLGVGGSKTQNEHLQKRLDPLTGSGRVIALCSDAMSEGVNLQRASSMVHLDMPSVVRYAEQRVGRIDRMDSPHDTIECWWPLDAPAFALKADEKFVARIEEVESLLGGNLQLPQEMLREEVASRVVSPEDFQSEMQARSVQPWDGIEDAFSPVRGLVEGDAALVRLEDYHQAKADPTAVLSRVSLVRAQRPWLFVCLAGEANQAPRWVFLSDEHDAPLINLRDVVAALRGRLIDDVHDLQPSRAAGRELDRLLGRLSKMERLLLPRKKQRALEQMAAVLSGWVKQPDWIQSSEQADQINMLMDILSPNGRSDCPDWGQLADAWLDLVRPTWSRYLDRGARKAAITRLRDIQKSLLADPVPAQQLLDRVAGIATRQTWEERIVACVLGYSGA
ncbi:SNF2-related protein [Pseudomonas aeruginosa]|uniref:SNF2-related protein n=1 Tax=Pseudomonas aeruginosa TaxID=287 RepID=UPI001F03BD2C|nr:SNF2-related protein [Pseudomonas aeruginosa]EIY2609043.1 helicase [Pseudomonas aeruginosa]EIY2741124.1 helicase [Pseudomonas aeruginosa]EKM0200622.1 helicase [Pseudomonas aeruginosa]EKM0220152.1 helicase [Pseudomonas aeruginosa]EKU2852830.1 helicase [Pseudomonas aeruginosa]